MSRMQDSKCQVEKSEDKCCVSLSLPCPELCTCHLCNSKYQSVFSNADDDNDPVAADDDIVVKKMTLKKSYCLHGSDCK